MEALKPNPGATEANSQTGAGDFLAGLEGSKNNPSLQHPQYVVPRIIATHFDVQDLLRIAKQLQAGEAGGA